MLDISEVISLLLGAVTLLVIVLKLPSEKRRNDREADLDEFEVMTRLNQSVIDHLRRVEGIAASLEGRVRKLEDQLSAEKSRTTKLLKRVRQLEDFIRSLGLQVPEEEDGDEETESGPAALGSGLTGSHGHSQHTTLG
jgi:vacuolar-type H+-ATPase subunit I/STV1